VILSLLVPMDKSKPWLEYCFTLFDIWLHGRTCHSTLSLARYLQPRSIFNPCQVTRVYSARVSPAFSFCGAMADGSESSAWLWRAGGYAAGDCQPQSSDNRVGCDGSHHNLDLYTKGIQVTSSTTVTSTTATTTVTVDPLVAGA
jgi:hypothetical protein